MPVYSDYLSDPRYSVRAMSDAIMSIPNEYSLLADLGLFPEVGISTTYVEIEAKNGSLNLIPTSLRGGPAGYVKRDTRNLRVMKTLFQSLNDKLVPSDLQNLPAFGDPMGFERFDTLLQERFARLQAGYRQTHEYFRWGALRGNVYDADGTSVLYNCYTEMGESQQSFDMKFGTTDGTAGPTDAITSLRRFHQKEAKGEPMGRTLVLCSAGFMDKLRKHSQYVKIWENQQAAANPIIDGFTSLMTADALYVEHVGEATYVADDGTVTTHQFIPANEAIAVPLGTRQVFRSYFAPAEMMSAVNMPGQAMYVSLKELDHDGGIEIHTQSAPLFVVQKPRLVARLYSSN
jgi:hypothetical protein